jgi:hypothetical protein
MRQFERFYSALGRFQFEAFSSNFDIFSIKLNSILNHNGINIISCSKKALGRHVNQSIGAMFLKNPTKNTNSATIQASSLQDISLSNEIYPNLVNLENSLFPYGDIGSSALASTHTQSLNDLTGSIFHNTLQINSSIYSVLISLTVFNTHHTNRL